MKPQSLQLRDSLLLLAVILALPAVRAAAQTKPDAASAPASQSKAQPRLKPLLRDDENREKVQEGPEFLRARQNWFFQPRAFPLGFIPQGARERALQQKMQMYQREGRVSFLAAPGESGLATPPTGINSAWFPIGPQPTNSLANPPFTSGRVTALAVNPNNANNVYLGGADGGLWVTTDGGSTWTPLTDNPPDAANIPTVAVGAIAVDPTTCGTTPSGICKTVYVGTGEDNFAGDNIYGEGVLICTVTTGTPPTASCTQDSTFHSVSPLDQTRGGPLVGALAVNRATGKNNILLAGVRGRGSALQSGVWCSADKGATWTHVLPVIAPTATGDPGTDVAFASDGTAWAALGFPFPTTGNGIYKSSAPVTSCTITFNQQTLPSNFTASNIGRITLALAPSSNATIYAAIADATVASANLLGVLRSTNANMAAPTWTQLTDPLVSAATGFCTGQCFFDMALSVDPVNPAVVYAGGSGQDPIIRTTTGTTTASFSDVTGAGGTVPHADTHAFSFAPDGSKLWVGNDGGVWSTSTPAGTISWSNLNGQAGTSTGALNLTQFYPGVSIHPSNPGFAMGGSQDNGIQVNQAASVPPPSASLLWQDAGLGCDGGYTVIDPAIPSTTYGECEYLANTILIIAVTFSGDGILLNGFQANTGIDGADRGSFIPPLVIDKNATQTLYFGTCRVWQTLDGALSWNAISPDVTSPTHPAGCSTSATGVLSTIAVAPSNSSVIYVGSDNGDVEVTSNGGSSWTSIATSTLPTRAVTQVAVDPLSVGTAYVTFSGFGTCNNSTVTCDGKGHVFKTVNGTSGAAAWVDINGTAPNKLPDIPVNAIVIDPDDAAHNTLYVGTDIGAFFTTDGGVNWSPLGAAGSLPNAQILSLTLHDASRTLRAATHGRGVWDLNLGGQAPFGITSISPFTANAGAASITNFTVNGNGFTSSSVVKFTAGGTTTSLATNCATANTCTATIPMAQLQNGVAAQVTVANGAASTNSVVFTVLNPVPGITSIMPTSTTAGTNGLLLTVNGSSFLSGANGTLVLLNTIPLPASAVAVQSSTVLTVQIPASNLTTAQTVTVDTFNPQPGGGPDTNPTPPILIINNPAPTITSLSPPSATAGGAAFTLTVNGTGFNASSGVTFNGVAKTPTIVSSSQLTVLIAASDIATAGTFAVQVSNPTPGGGSASMNFTVSSTGSFTIGGSAVTVTAGSSNASTITVTPSGGFTGTVNVTCPAAGLPTGVTCSPNPLAVNVTSASPVTPQLIVAVAAPSSVLSASAAPTERKLFAAGMIPSSGGRGWWMLSAGTGLAAIVLLLLPGRKRYRGALGLGLVCVLSFALGCGGNNGSGGGPATTSTTISVPASPGTKVSSGTNIPFTVTVTSTGTAANGQVQLFDGTGMLGSAVSVVNGSATINNAGLTPGTHAISAHYLGDASTKMSQSGTLNVTVTGQTTFVIQASPAASNGSPSVNITIQ